jgi:hypothetical protein
MGIVGRPMTIGEIQELVSAFASAALRCKEGGLDGVELNAAHGYIFHQFLSTLSNNRTDRYGGEFSNRVRFLREVLLAVRQAVGVDFCLGIRLSASEALGGITEEENNKVLALVQDEGLIDYVSVSKGDYYRLDTMLSCMQSPAGYELGSAGQTTATRRVPAIVAGRFRTLEEADQVIREGVADLVSMVRAQIADPDLVRKTKEGRPEAVRPCIGCNQGCIGGIIRTGRLGCTVNATAGWERDLAEDNARRASRSREVLVVGGGPAGMEAARVLATAGHKVVLAEASTKLGGAVNVARQAPRLQGIADITFWLEQEVYRLGVEVQLSTYLEADDVRQRNPEALIVATGSSARLDGHQIADPGVPARGSDLPHVISASELISTPRDLGRTALVLDTVGHYEALAVVEVLMSRGLSVTFLTSLPSLAPYVQTTYRDVPALERFYQLGDFTPLTRHKLVEIQQGSCLVRPLQAGPNQVNSVLADTVVLVTPNEPLRSLFDELRGELTDIHLVGDALSPRDVQHAIREGHRAARALA